MEIIKIRKSKSLRLKNQFDEYYHVASLVPKGDDFKPVFQYIYSTGSEIVSTDSRSLHKAKIEIEKGYYQVILCTNRLIILHKEGESIEGLQFPNYEAVIPKNHETWDHVTLHFEGPLGLSKSFAKIVKLIKQNILIDINRIKNFKYEWTCYCNNNPENLNPPLVFEDKTKSKYALIMPIQVREQ